MKNIVHRHAGREGWCHGKSSPGRQFGYDRCLCKGKYRTLVHYLVYQPRHIAFFGLAFFLLVERGDAFGEVAFAVAMHLRPVFIFAKVRDDVFPSDLEIQVQQRNHPYFDQHEAQQAEGDPLFGRISHNFINEQTGRNGVAAAKVMTNRQKLEATTG